MMTEDEKLQRAFCELADWAVLCSDMLEGSGSGSVLSDDRCDTADCPNEPIRNMQREVVGTRVIDDELNGRILGDRQRFGRFSLEDVWRFVDVPDQSDPEVHDLCKSTL